MSDSCNPMDCSPPGSSIHVISQARILEWVAISSYRESSQPRTEIQSPALQADSLPTKLVRYIVYMSHPCNQSPRQTSPTKQSTHSYKSSYIIRILLKKEVSVQFSSVAQSCLTLCDPMNHSTPGFPVNHQLLEST